MLRHIRLSHRLYLLVAVLALGGLAYGAWSFKTLNEIKVGGPVYQRIEQSQQLVADILPPPLYVVEAYLVCLQLTSEVGSTDAPRLVERLELLHRQFLNRAQYWATARLGNELDNLVAHEALPSAQAFYRVAQEEFIPAFHARQPTEVLRAQQKLAQHYDAHRKVIDRMVVVAQQRMQDDETWAERTMRDATRAQLVYLFLSLAMGVILAVRIFYSISRPLQNAVGMAHAVAAGHLDIQNDDPYPDEVGQLLVALREMGASLHTTMAAQRDAETRSRHAKDMLERLIDTANVMVVGVDFDGNVAIFNTAAEEVTGYRRAQVLGQTWATLGIVCEPEIWQLRTLRDVLVNVPLQQNQNITTQAGEVRTIYWRNSVQQDTQDHGVAIISFGLDVTEQLRAELALVEARQTAEAANQSKSEFLANMSHEIRTPMNAIIGMTGLALRTDLTAKQRNYLEKVSAAADGLLGIINDVLDFSKIEAGKLSFEHRDFSLARVLDHLASLSAAKVQSKGLELLFDVPTSLPDGLIGDEMRLGQVLLNLVSNAIKFTEHGEIHVRIRCLEAQGRSTLLRFEVQDTGIGLTTEQKTRLFAPFVQADASTTRRFGGTGLGLSIARRLVEIMEGELWVQSTPGVGSTFIFTARLGVQANQHALSADQALQLSHLRVLAVDDNASARIVVGGILDSMHIHNTVVDSGPAALIEIKKAQQNGSPYHLVLMDWQMPGMSGVEAVRDIRALGGMADTLSVVIVTAYNRDELLEDARGLHLDDILEKPISPSKLLDSIMRTVGCNGTRTKKPTARASYETLATQLHGAYVLLVEDNEVNQELAVDILTQAGLRVDIANHGQEALDQIARHTYDAVLMDWQMPVMDGFEATRRIRAQAQWAELPILAMTANAMAGDREKCLAVGMNDHLTKPIVVEELMAALARWIKRDAAALQPPNAPSKPDSTATEPPPPVLEGVDVDSALRRLRGNVDQYRRLLARFVQSHSHAVEDLRRAWRSGAREEAQRQAHTLKGLAANIGADALQRAAQALEWSIHNQEDHTVPPQIEALELPVQSLLQGIAHMQP